MDVLLNSASRVPVTSRLGGKPCRSLNSGDSTGSRGSVLPTYSSSWPRFGFCGAMPPENPFKANNCCESAAVKVDEHSLQVLRKRDERSDDVGAHARNRLRFHIHGKEPFCLRRLRPLPLVGVRATLG